VYCYSVTHRELHLVSVLHGQDPFLLEFGVIEMLCTDWAGSLFKAGAAIMSFNDEFRLEEPCLIPPYLWLLLAVYQEQGHHGPSVVRPDYALDHYIRLFR